MNASSILPPLPWENWEGKRAHPTKHRRSAPLPPLTEREEVALASGAKLIPLTRGKWAIVDAEDFERLSKVNWCAVQNPWGKTFYATRNLRTSDGKETTIRMHRLLLPGCPEVDHQEQDGLNNRKSNLRPATFADNQRNKGIRKNNTTGFKGVHYSKAKRKFGTHITAGGKIKHLGYFNTAEEAHAVYAAAARCLHGEFASV